MSDTAVLAPTSVTTAESQQAAAADATAAAALLATRLTATGVSAEEIVANARFQQLTRTAARQIVLANAAARLIGDGARGLVEAREPEIVEKIQQSLIEASASRAERFEEDDVDSPEEQERWADNAGNSLSTQLVGETSMDLAKPVEEQLGVKLKKLWMSRGDNKVRGSHRKLHGSAADLDKPFWRELGTGRALRFPGDPAAPIEQTINCRCWLWFVPEDQAAEAEKTFQMPESEFELIAASGHAHGPLDDLDPTIIAAAYDVAMGLLAAPVSDSERQRRFEESAHERSAIGQFAQKPKANLQTSAERRVKYDEQARREGYSSYTDYMQQAAQRRPGKEGKRRVGGAGGGSEKDEAKAAAKEKLRVQQEAEREQLRVKQEDEREKLRVKHEAEREKLTAEQEGEDEGLSEKQEAEREGERARRQAMLNERRNNVEMLLARRRMEDAAKRGERLSEDEALLQIAEEVKETERQAREKQRDAERAMADIERSREYIRAMRLRGEDVAIIDAERERMLGLENDHEKIVGEVEALFEQSRKLGTSDTVRKLRDRARLSRRAEDDAIRNDRAQLDAAIRLKNQAQDDDQRSREMELRGRQRTQTKAQTSEQRQEKREQSTTQREERRTQSAAQREERRSQSARQRTLRGAGDSPHSCIICLLPVGDREITYNDGGTSPMHMTLGYMGDAAQYDDIDKEMFGIAVEEIADRIPPFTAKVAGQATLGEDSDAVTLIEAPEIARARDYVMNDGGLSYAIGHADEHPNWIPHVTGLTDVDYQDDVEFDRLGLWVGENRQEYPLNG